MNNKDYQQTWLDVLSLKNSAEDSMITIGMDVKTINLYSNFVRNRYAEALKKMFPRIQELIKLDWIEVSNIYFKKYPPYDWDLNDLTLNFADFLVEAKDQLEIDDYIIELARFELLEFFVYKSDTYPILKSSYEINPTLQFESFNYDIGEWVKRMDTLESANKIEQLRVSRPNLENTLLLVCRDFKTNLCVFTKSSTVMAILIELIQENDFYSIEQLHSSLIQVVKELGLSINPKIRDVQNTVDFMKNQRIIV